MADRRGNQSHRIPHGLAPGSRGPPHGRDQGRRADTCQRPARRPCPTRLGPGHDPRPVSRDLREPSDPSLGFPGRLPAHPARLPGPVSSARSRRIREESVATDGHS